MYIKMIKVREDVNQLFLEYILENSDEKMIRRMEEVIMNDVFESDMLYLIEKKLYTTQKIFELVENCLKLISEESSSFNTLEDIMNYTYQYVLALSFEESANIEFEEGKDKIARLSLDVLRLFFNLQREFDDESWVSKYKLKILDKSEEDALEDDEYKRFRKFLDEEYVYEMMKMNQDIMGYSTLDHICGVHHLAVKVGRQLKHLNMPIDLGRVSGAAYGHDIGKYGCKPEESRKIAYYHYYYTAEWFNERDIVYIRNVAFNHSTWDLEIANLSLESLVLIYCDFRVKANEDKSSIYPMKYYGLDEAFDVILNKLDNVDSAKEARYRKVYNRLKDFEDYMIEHGINVDPDSENCIQEGHTIDRKHYSIMQSDKIVESAKYLAISHNIGIMHRLRDENSLNAMLENARGIENISSLRSYQNIIEEYSDYLTQKQKLITLNFLYEQLMLPAEDIRKQTAKLIGLLISNFDEIERKELPKGARRKTVEIDSLKLFENYVSKCLFPNLRIIGKHKEWIRLSLSSMVKSLLANSSDEKCEIYMKAFILNLKRTVVKTELAPYVLEAIRNLPFERLSDKIILSIIKYVNNLAYIDDPVRRIQCYDVLCNIIPKLKKEHVNRIRTVHTTDDIDDISAAEIFARFKILQLIIGENGEVEVLRQRCISKVENTSEVYLSNLKSATSWVCKKLQIELLLRFVVMYKQSDSFYLSMHLCNLLKVSSHEMVRNAAGKGLVELSKHLTDGQKNDIVIELLRALEMENYQYTKYICEYLGVLMLELNLEEFYEIIDSFREKIERANSQICTLVLITTSVVLENLQKENYSINDHRRIQKKLLGIMLKGLVNYDTKVTQASINVIGKHLFDSKQINFDDKAEIFNIVIKKILSLMANTDETVELIYLNNSAGLSHIYNFISEYTLEKGDLLLDEYKKVAFFPGAFDPFSLSHKEIARSIRDLGFEVYLSVDEFSWSKRTQPNLTRRDIIKMSIADEFNIYVFPRDISVNIANPEDLKILKETYDKSEVYIVIGSDVILNASAYKKEAEEFSIHNFSHVIFERQTQIYSFVEKERLEKNIKALNKDIERLLLPSQFEQISSTQIRNYIDENRDISDLIDPLAQKYIYERGLYQREPQFKEMVTTKSVYVEIVETLSEELIDEIISTSFDSYKPNREELIKYSKEKKPRAIILRSIKHDKRIIGYSIFHWLRSSNVYVEFENKYFAEYVLKNSVGRILVIDSMVVSNKFSFSDAEQMVLTETLSFCLSKDYSYSIINMINGVKISERFHELYELHGFIEVPDTTSNESIYVVEMSSPCILNLDARTVMKEPLRSNNNVNSAVKRSRKRLQKAITQLHPGQLVLSFDRTMLYENLIKKICDNNNVRSVPTHPRVLGDAMCVPFGAVFKRWILPNTVTKALHTERFFTPDVETSEIQAYPYYLDITNQVKRIKSFKRPVILVDDLLNKGYRIKEIEPILREEGVEIKKIIVGIMSGRGKSILENQNIEVDSAYFIPRLKVWFNESLMYPFLGGDTLWRGVIPTRNIIPSINLILPYTSPNYIHNSTMEAIYNLSEVCIENSIDILKVLEEEYQYLHENSLTLAHLGEVLISPRFPDRGEKISYDTSQKSSDYLKNDLEQLKRLKKYIHK